MTMHSDDRGGVVVERTARDFARIDGRLGQRAEEQLLVRNQPQLRIEQQQTEDLTVEQPVMQMQPLPETFGRVHDLCLAQELSLENRERSVDDLPLFRLEIYSVGACACTTICAQPHTPAARDGFLLSQSASAGRVVHDGSFR